MVLINIREETEQIEAKILSPYASLSKNSLGRKKEEPECNIRTAYQRDRDRIIYSKSFRRLKHKTQVFIAPLGDHYRTRLTHTLEVSQIARTIARSLRLNEDLTEAIALGHDLGHTPFGHAGECALDKISSQGFRHYEQSVRVLEKLEKNGEGLNLSLEVYDGILCHTKGKEAKTLEGRVVRLADRMAYINHDIDDAIRAEILNKSDIPKDIIETLGKNGNERVNTLVCSIVENSSEGNLKMNNEIYSAFERLHSFMYDSVYLNLNAKREEHKVPILVDGLYSYYKNNYKKLPQDMQKIANEDGIERAVCDYIAGMTDRFAVKTFKEIYIPKSWNI